MWSLLAIGSLNWGLIGLFNFNLIAAVLGDMTILCRLVYILVGLSAAYHVATVLIALIRFKMQYRTSINCPEI